MKKLFIVFVVATAVQSTTLSGMQRYIKNFFTDSGKKTSATVVKKVAASDHEKPLEYESDVLGTFELLEHQDIPVSPEELSSIAEEAASKKKSNSLLTTILENDENPKKRNPKKRKRTPVFQIFGLQFSGRMNLDDFERIYGLKNKKTLSKR